MRIDIMVLNPHLHIHVITVPVLFEEPDCMRALGTMLGIHKAPGEGRNCMSSTLDIRWCDEAMPLGRGAWFGEL